MDKSKWFNQLKTEIRRRNYSFKTERAYLRWVKRYLQHANIKAQKQINKESVTRYLNHLAIHRNVAGSTQNQALCAIVFFTEQVIGKKIGRLANLQRARESQNIPVVLSKQEVKKILLHISGVRLLVVKLLYGSGLRISEALRLRVKDIDFEYQQLLVRNAKGLKDRATVLPASLVKNLRSHIQKVKNLHNRDLVKGWGDFTQSAC